MRHSPLHALKFRIRRTAGGIVEEPSVSASYKLQYRYESQKDICLNRERREEEWDR